MITLKEGQSIDIQGSGKKPYKVKYTGGVISCSCPAWLNQSKPIDQRTCKHIDGNVDVAATKADSNTLKKFDMSGLNVQDVTSFSIEGSPIFTKMVASVAVNFAQDLVKASETKEKPVAPPCMLAHEWDGEQDLTGWLLSPKLDGVRALFDGEKFISRNGNTLHAPAWFIKAIKDKVGAVAWGTVKLDGELWMGNGTFQECSGAVRKLVPVDAEWEKITYQVFDYHTSQNEFPPLDAANRQVWLSEVITPGKYLHIVPQIPCENNAFLNAVTDAIVEQGGEGIMAKNPASLYKSGRSNDLLKVKRFKDA